MLVGIKGNRREGGEGERERDLDVGEFHGVRYTECSWRKTLLIGASGSWPFTHMYVKYGLVTTEERLGECHNEIKMGDQKEVR